MLVCYHDSSCHVMRNVSILLGISHNKFEGKWGGGTDFFFLFASMRSAP